MRRAIQQMLFSNRDFSWLRHVLIAVILLTGINLLVIFAPNILGIFGVIGKCLALWCVKVGYHPRGSFNSRSLNWNPTFKPWQRISCRA